MLNPGWPRGSSVGIQRGLPCGPEDAKNAPRCGKAGCRCEQGEKHVSLYLSVKIEGKRRMVYIPAQLEEEVRRRVDAYREVERLTQVVSEACVNRVLERKREPKDNG